MALTDRSSGHSRLRWLVVAIPYLWLIVLFLAPLARYLPVPAMAGILFIVAGFAAYEFTNHVPRRVNAWLDPFSDYDANLQIISAQFGFAWGGLFGRGWGLGRPGLTPLAKSDMIAAALGEEIGILGLMAIIMLYALLVARGCKAALTCSAVSSAPSSGSNSSVVSRISSATTPPMPSRIAVPSGSLLASMVGQFFENLAFKSVYSDHFSGTSSSG